MLFALVALDKPGALTIRQETRAAHLAYIAETSCVQMAGPFLDDAGEEGASNLRTVHHENAGCAWDHEQLTG